jgi:hypothetical protein
VLLDEFAGPRNTYPGETLTVIGEGVIVTAAEPVWTGVVWLVAVNCTLFGEGTRLGARNSTPPETGPDGAAQGLELGTQIRPVVEFPFAIPFTAHATAVFGAFATEAPNNARWPAIMLRLPGEMVTRILSVTVAPAFADCTGFDWLVARIVTVFGEGIVAGAV